MDKIELSSSKLFVVRPSIVTFDDTKYGFRKTMDKILDVSPTLKLSRYQIRCIKTNLHEFRKKVIELEKKNDRTELEELELENAKETISNLEKVSLEKPTISDYIKDFKWDIARAEFNRAKEKNVNDVTHIVQFETKPEDITVAYEDSFVLKNIENNKVIYDGFGHHCVEGDLYVGVAPNDKVLLARYLWGKNVHNTEYNYEIERYILSLKPFYTTEEIIAILEQLRSEMSFIKENPKVFTLEKKRKEPIFIKTVYSDMC